MSLTDNNYVIIEKTGITETPLFVLHQGKEGLPGGPGSPGPKGDPGERVKNCLYYWIIRPSGQI